MEEKDCLLIFGDKTPNYEFSSKNIGVALKTAKERNWDVVAIRTPDYMLSILSHEEYENGVNFESLGL